MQVFLFAAVRHFRKYYDGPGTLGALHAIWILSEKYARRSESLRPTRRVF